MTRDKPLPRQGLADLTTHKDALFGDKNRLSLGENSFFLFFLSLSFTVFFLSLSFHFFLGTDKGENIYGG